MLPVRLRGARTHNLRGVDLDLPAGSVRRADGAERRGKVVARDGHPLRGGSAEVRRELQPVRAAVPGAARAAADGLARPGRRDGRCRPQGAREVEPLDARDDGRPGALPRSALRLRRGPFLSQLRARGGDDRPCSGRFRSGRGVGRGAGRGQLRRPGRGRRGVPRPARGAHEGRLSPAVRGRRRAGHRRREAERGVGGAGARRGRRRPHCSRGGSVTTPAAGHRGRVGAGRRTGRGPRRSRRSRRQGGHDRTSHGRREGPRLPAVCASIRAAPPRAVLVQLAARCMRSVPRLWTHHRDRLGQGLPRSEEDAPRRRDTPLARQEQRVGAPRAPCVREEARSAARRAVGGADGGAARARRRRRRDLEGGEVSGRQGLVQVARGADLQDARAGAARAVPGVRAVSRLPDLAPQS